MKKLLLILCLCITVKAWSSVLLGTGISSATQGRLAPTFFLGLENGNRIVHVTAVGVATEVYYHSTYRVSFYKQESWSKGKKVGFGLGAMYSERGYKDSKDEEGTVKSDFIIGPGFRAEVNFGKHLFISVETMFGISNIQVIVLAFQNTNALTMGVRF